MSEREIRELLAMRHALAPSEVELINISSVVVLLGATGFYVEWKQEGGGPYRHFVKKPDETT